MFGLTQSTLDYSKENYEPLFFMITYTIVLYTTIASKFTIYLIYLQIIATFSFSVCYPLNFFHKFKANLKKK